MSDVFTVARLSPSQVAILLGISERSLTRWVKEGRFPKPVAWGKARHWEQPVVEAWMAAAKEASQR